MTKIKICGLMGLLTLASCNQDIDISEAERAQTSTQVLDTSADRGVLSDVLRVKLTPNVATRLEKQLATSEGGLRSLGGELGGLLEHIGALKMERVFPHAGELEERQRAAGLHLWYDISFDDQKAAPYQVLAEAMKRAKAFAGIQVAEEVRVLQTPSTAYKLVEPSQGLRAESASGFDDPELPKQWHYHNVGQTMRSKAGADINLFEAWKSETGKPNVTVAIVDGGIDFLHEDLKDNMFINQKEMDGEIGVDDDKNGMVDDVYGYNFVTESGDITPHDHGTHVAGTVAARSNNGVGVAGVAGGNGTEGSGARLLSCQMFHTDEEGRTVSSASAGARAIVYGANMGAVISQNSWGYRNAPNQAQPLSQSDQEAIDYFIKYAGCDKDGNQRADSPMKGGVVIFAAGNDGRDYLSFPAAYGQVVSVSSMAPDFTAAYYTNRGEWVKVMAPGGSFLYSKGEVLSTLPNHAYGYMQGTSMACPHVSGIAALIVSKYGGPGFTNEELKQRLTTAVRADDINEFNPKFVKRLGAGYVDAALALAPRGENEAPEGVAKLSAEATHTGVQLSWNVASDANDGTAYAYNLYYSEVKIDAKSYKEALKVEVMGARKLGQKIQYLHQGLRPSSTYYYAVEAVDRWGAVAKSVALATVTTMQNIAPILKLDDDSSIRLTGAETLTRKILVTEPDGQKWAYEVEGEDYDVKHKRNEAGEIELTFRVSRPKGKYAIVVSVTDELGLKSTIEIPFEFYKNHAPQLAKPLGRIYASVGQTAEIDLSEYFHDQDKTDKLAYSVRALNPDMATAKISGSKLEIKAQALGLAGFEIASQDPLGLTVKTGLSVECVTSDLVHIVYPTLVQDFLNIRVADGVRRVYVSVLTPAGAPVMAEKTFDLDKGAKISLDLRLLSAGTYTLLVESKDKKFMQSFIKR